MKRQINFLLLLLLFAAPAAAQTAEVRKKQYNLGTSGVAIQGYDPVAYFTNNKAIEGQKDLTASYNGVVYRFSSKQNKDEFMRSPARYEPQFGGWCAYAMGQNGDKVGIDPGTFKIIDGKLYLFYNKFFNNTLKIWNQDEARLRTQADRNWMKFVP